MASQGAVRVRWLWVGLYEDQVTTRSADQSGGLLSYSVPVQLAGAVCPPLVDCPLVSPVEEPGKGCKNRITSVDYMYWQNI